MRRSDFQYFEAVQKAIVRKEVKAELCKHCYPACIEYEFKLFGKKINVNFISGGNLVDINGRGMYINNTRFNIVLDLREVEFYRTHKHLLR